MTADLHIPPSGHWRILKRNATIMDVAQDMVSIIRAMKTDFFTLTEAEFLQMFGKNILQDLANRAYDNMYFEPDRSDLQTLRTPVRSFRDKRANCVDYTIFIASIANAMGLPVKIRLAQLPGQNDYGHVYPVVDGVAIDVVPVQLEDGTEYFNRIPGTKPQIGKELEALKTLDFVI